MKISIETISLCNLMIKYSDVLYPDNVFFRLLPYYKIFRLFLFQLTLNHEITIIRMIF